jgi:hypothetical protein
MLLGEQTNTPAIVLRVGNAIGPQDGGAMRGSNGWWLGEGVTRNFCLAFVSAAFPSGVPRRRTSAAYLVSTGPRYLTKRAFSRDSFLQDASVHSTK